MKVFSILKFFYSSNNKIRISSKNIFYDLNLFLSSPLIIKEHLLSRRADKQLLSSIDEIIELQNKRVENIITNNNLKHQRKLLSQKIGNFLKMNENITQNNFENNSQTFPSQFNNQSNNQTLPSQSNNQPLPSQFNNQTNNQDLSESSGSNDNNSNNNNNCNIITNNEINELRNNIIGIHNFIFSYMNYARTHNYSHRQLRFILCVVN